MSETSFRRLSTACAGLVVMLLLAGCSGGGSGRQLVHKVRGKITMAGGPVAGAVVTFSPKPKQAASNTPQPVAIGRTNDSGEYTLMTYDPGDGAVEGEFVVLVTKAVAKAATAPQGGHDPKSKVPYDSNAAHEQSVAAQKDAQSGLPEKYSTSQKSDLIAKVAKGGKNVFDFDLKP